MASIRARLVSSHIIFSALIAVAFALTINFFLRPGLLAIEQQAGRDLATRFHFSLQSDIDNIDHLAKDWAIWDASYSFIRNHNKAFLRENFDDTTFTSTDLNIIAYINLNGKVVHAETYDFNSEERHITHRLDIHTPPGTIPFWDVKDLNDGHSGLWRQWGKTYLFATAPITDSTASKPPRGIVLMARELDERLLSSLGARLKTDITLTPPDALQTASLSHAPKVITDDDESAHVTTPLFNYYGQPISSVILTMPRDLYVIGMKAATNTAWIGIGASLLMSLILAAITHKLVSAPLRDLSRKVNHVAESQDKRTANALPVQRKDEIGIVARAVQRMYVRTIFLANHDPLTNLPNKTLFQRALHKATDAQKNRSDDGKGLLIIAIESFQEINELYGPQEGDRILEAVSQRINAVIREKDFLARVGGVNFSIICDGIRSATELGAVAQKIIALMDEDFPLSDHRTVTICLNIGGALIQPGAAEQMATTAAENCLMRAKKSGTNTYYILDQAASTQPASEPPTPADADENVDDETETEDLDKEGNTEDENLDGDNDDEIEEENEKTT